MIDRALDVFETINRDTKFGDIRWFLDHAKTVSEKNMERSKHSNSDDAVQHRVTFQEEFFADQYGQHATEHKPPLLKMLNMGIIPVGGDPNTPRVSVLMPSMYTDLAVLPHDTSLPSVNFHWPPVNYFGYYRDSGGSGVVTNACIASSCGHCHTHEEDGKLFRQLDLDKQKKNASL